MTKKKCRCHKRKITKKGRLTYDKDHPGDKTYAMQKLTYECPDCGKKTESESLPYLLNDLFSI